jgi:hypothetical protein
MKIGGEKTRFTQGVAPCEVGRRYVFAVKTILEDTKGMYHGTMDKKATC